MRRASARLFSWWLGELFALLPRRLRQEMERRARRVLVDMGESAARVLLSDLGGPRLLAELPLEGALPPEAADAVRGAALQAGEVIVRVGAARALRRTVAVPLAAERNLAEVLGYEMDRYTPFGADAVYYGHAVIGRDPERRTLQAALTVVPRKDVDPLLERLRALGLQPHVLEVAHGDGEPAAVNLLPAAQSRARHGRPRWPARLLGAAAALLLLAVIALPFAQKARLARTLHAQIDALKGDATQAEVLRKDLAQLAAQERALVERRVRRPAAIEVLRELSALLPENTWLSQVEISASRVKLRGESANASELVTLLEDSPMFRNVAFEGSLIRDPSSGAERFALSAAAEPPERP